MKRTTTVCLMGLVGLAGCSDPAPNKSGPATSQTAESADGEAATFVSLKVPNMH